MESTYRWVRPSSYIVSALLVATLVVIVACTRQDRRTVVHAIEDIVNVVCSDSDPLPLCLKKVEAYQAALDAGASKEEAKQKALAIKP